MHQSTIDDILKEGIAMITHSILHTIQLRQNNDIEKFKIRIENGIFRILKINFPLFRQFGSIQFKTLIITTLVAL